MDLFRSASRAALAASSLVLASCAGVMSFSGTAPSNDGADREPRLTAAPTGNWRAAAAHRSRPAAAFAATLRGLRNTGYDVSLVSANGFSNVFLNFSLPGSRRDVEDFDVLCCYEAVFVRGGV